MDCYFLWYNERLLRRGGGVSITIGCSDGEVEVFVGRQRNSDVEQASILWEWLHRWKCEHIRLTFGHYLVVA